VCRHADSASYGDVHALRFEFKVALSGAPDATVLGRSSLVSDMRHRRSKYGSCAIRRYAASDDVELLICQ